MTAQSHKANAASYLRISTVQHGQDIDNQRHPIKSYCESKGNLLTLEFLDEGVSGAKERRPGLDALMKSARQGRFNVLVVAEFSRLARDVRHLLNLLHELQELGISVVSLREGIDGSTGIGRAMIAMIGVIVGVERDLLRERIRTALATKKQKALETGSGWRCGPKLKVTAEVQSRINELRLSGLSIRAIAREVGLAKSSVQLALQGVRKPS